MKKTLLWLMLLVVSAGVHASTQVTVTIGSGGVHSHQPPHWHHRPPPPKPQPPLYPHYPPYYPYQQQIPVVVQPPLEPIAVESLRVGDRLPVDYRFNDYRVEDYAGHGLKRPSANQAWVLIGERYFLYNDKTHSILEVIQR